jgi:low affinity Fe/Cu permease
MRDSATQHDARYLHRMSAANSDSVRDRVEDGFAALAGKTAAATGSFWAFGLALLVIAIWAVSGPAFHFSSTWQLVINTGTTIVTFLMVFVIQHAQNKEMRAVQLKLNELIAATKGASNRLIDVEDLSDRELEHLYARYCKLVDDAQRLEPGARTTIDDEKEAEEAGVEKEPGRGPRS